MKLIKKIPYPLDVLTLVELTENAKTEFLYIKSDVSKLIESYGIEVLYHADIINQHEYNNKQYDICISLRFKDEIIHRKYLESHKTDETLKVFLKTIKSRYDVQLSEI